ncbi:PHD and RING finger domain-containing protein 1 isoform X2 [Notolabrus celidotus]|uniref:PHD and RING finger domain-containing protein 1 isoform X2 n=1 Tax=Notolabrus celidotus TaxID=1203425 RepID=UPI00149055E8|nr:PHD and RING finger domain-containing protein 1 isoform X2 [Notolabrus celidotus]XP_034542514.1 PHD and RING finger domain-containing protein 1 isoform X2 [Notolabrus celidotus]XP_034542515.1 PHD and RING finger domain-containing protein 1 isoform X2 [Notolabrus celidotus]
MDEDDSQDEQINRSTSHNKGKRAALWAISDDSDDNGAESDEGESDSSEEEGEGPLDGEEDEEDEEEDDDDEEEGNEEENDNEEEEDAKAEGGAFEGTSADLAEMSSDEDADKCPICLNSFNSQPVATPENCEHYFCLDCILEWAKNANSCPVDRIAFNSIYLRKCFGGKVKKVITVQKPVKEGQEEIINVDFEQTNCEVCGGSDREDRLLLCDGCDAGYHMECLTPPIDSVPVEEWFCPECEANNRHSRVSVEEISDTESLPSTAGPTTSRHQSRAVGPTRAIARTQQSERVRANVNRHRITQARSSQLAPTYLIQSTWLDETINAVVAGLNTSVYIRNLTPRIPSSRRRKTGRRRRVKKTSSARGKNGKVASTGVKRRRRRKVRRTKSRKKLVLKSASTRSRIANNLGIVKDKKSSSLPTVYRPAEHTLSNMRADIGAASLSIYGDPFDLDPFTEREEDDNRVRVTSLLEAKRRGISRSALRSHQPVARPITGGLSRRAADVPHSVGVAEAAPVPDLLGSILTGQSMLLMDSSDVVINRDGSLKAAKSVAPSVSKPGCSKSSISGDSSPNINSVMSPNQGEASLPVHYNGDLPGSTHSSMSRSFSQSTPCVPPYMPPSASRIQPSTHSDLPHRGHPSMQPVRPNRPNHPPGHRATNGVIDLTQPSSIHPTPDSGSKSDQSKKASIKPMWVDVSVLPKIPKLKRESSDGTNNATGQGASIVSNRTSNRENFSNSTPTSHVYGMPDTGTNSLAGNKGRQQSVDQQKGRAEGPSQRQRPDGAGSSSAFSNSFSSSSSSTGFSSSQSRFSSSSSASSSVSFRINSSGNSWQSRRLSMPSSSAGESSKQERWSKKEDEVKKRQMHRDKQMLLASHTPVKKEQDSTSIYDPFNPTLSDSDSEAESSQNAPREGEAASLGNKDRKVQNKQDLVRVKTERQDIEVSHEEPRGSSALENISQQVRCSEVFVKTEKETRSDTEKQKEKLKTEIKKEPGLDDPQETERFGNSAIFLSAEPTETTPPVHRSLVHVKTEREEVNEGSVGTSNSTPSNNSSASSSSLPTKKHKTEIKPDSKSSSKSPSRDLGSKRKTSQVSKEQPSSSSETERGKKGEQHASSQAGQQKEKEKKQDRNSRRSRSRERRKAHSSSESSQSNSPDRTHRKRQRSRSRSKDRRRSRSGSSSSSRERSRRKKHKQISKERNDDREKTSEKRQASKDKRHGRSCSKSMSKSRSRSRSRSKDRKRGRSRSKSRSKSRSRSRSRDRRKDNTRLQQAHLSSRDKAESHSKEKRRHRSRSSSRERRKDKGSSSKGSQTTSGFQYIKPQYIKKEKDIDRSSIKEKKVASVKKEEAPLCITASKEKKEDLRMDSQAKPAEMPKEIKAVKEIKKEKQPSLDMFGDSPCDKRIKEEAADIHTLVKVKGIHEEESKEEHIKTETCEILMIKSEPSSPEPCHLTPVTSFPSSTTPVSAESLQDKVSQTHPVAAAEQANTVGSTISVKQEVQQPSDDDDDFNVDVMLDNLDYVKSEPKEKSVSSVTKDKDVQEGKNEGEQVSVVVGLKSKTQVKRVTWNIQEPEGPQPEKSASKLALYKLRLKQEGLRRPSSTSQTTSQDNTGNISDPSRRGAGGSLTGSSRSDGAHPEGLPSTGETEEGDASGKDKQYLKKLHMQERAIEEVKLAIKPFYQRRDINKDEYKEILRKAVQKVCHSKSGEINPVKVGNLVKAYVDKYKHARKHKKEEDSDRTQEAQTEVMKTSDSP